MKAIPKVNPYTFEKLEPSYSCALNITATIMVCLITGFGVSALERHISFFMYK